MVPAIELEVVLSSVRIREPQHPVGGSVQCILVDTRHRRVDHVERPVRITHLHDLDADCLLLSGGEPDDRPGPLTPVGDQSFGLGCPICGCGIAASSVLHMTSHKGWVDAAMVAQINLHILRIDDAVLVEVVVEILLPCWPVESLRKPVVVGSQVVAAVVDIPGASPCRWCRWVCGGCWLASPTTAHEEQQEEECGTHRTRDSRKEPSM